MKVAYVVSRFPHVTETFILREVTAVDSRPDMEVELFSLFRPVDPTIHPAARPWMDRVHRSSRRAAVAGLVWWSLRRPLQLLRTVLLIVLGHCRRPAVLARALVTLPVAAAHARRMKELGIEHVHAHFATYPALTAWVCRRLAGIPYSVTPHSHDIYVHQCFLRRKIADARFFVAVSHFNRHFLSRFGGDRATPVHLVRYGIDPAAFPFRPRAIPEYGLVKTLCVASLREYKGHADLFRAVAKPGRNVGRIHLDLVGDGELRRDLERLATQLGIAHRVRFWGSRTEDQVLAHYDAADLFVLASTIAHNGDTEGLPNVLIEALACGIPTISTTVTGIPELIQDGLTGRLAPWGDPDSLHVALDDVLAAPSAARGLSEAGRRLVEAEYNIDMSASRLAELFRSE